MPRSFDLSAHYQGSVEQLLTVFADERYWLARLADADIPEATLDSLVVGDDGNVAVATTQRLAAQQLPALVTQLHRGDLVVKRREHWAAIVDDRSTASIDADIPGAPVRVSGDATLRPDGAGSRMDLTVTVEVRIPLVGGKVEGFIGSQLVDLIEMEQRFTSDWIAQQS